MMTLTIRRLWSFVAPLVLLLAIAGAASATPRPNPEKTWMTNGNVYAVARAGGRVYLAGDFTALTDGAGHSVPRMRIAAIDAVTGAPVDGFAPRADDIVWSLAVSPDGSRVYIGGQFHAVDGQPHIRIAALDSVTGQPVPGWTTAVNGGIVRDLVASNNAVYVGGGFTKVAGSRHRDLAALDPITGTPIPGWNAETDGSVRAVSLSVEDGRLYVGGTFDHLAGVARSNLGVLEATTGTPLPWDPSPSYPVLDLVTSAERAYVAGAGPGGTLAAFSPIDGAKEWSVSTDGDVQAVTLLGSRLYAGGHFTVAAGVSRKKIFAVDAATGALDAWAPQLNSVVGVRALDSLGTDLHVGGDFTQVNRRPRRGYAQFSDVPV
jgi:PQQ-like domain